MARLFTSGFEINSTTAGMEWSVRSRSEYTITTTNARSGTYCLNNGTAPPAGGASGWGITFATAGVAKTWYRTYFRIETAPASETTVMATNDTSNNTTPLTRITVDNSRVLRLYDEDGQVAGTTTLSLSVWYRLEMKIDTSGAGATDTVEAKVDGTTFATSATRNLSASPLYMIVGSNLNAEGNGSGSFSFDDVAINDDTGSYQNSYPGEGSVLLVPPGGAGSSNQWAVGVARIAGSSTNYQKVGENPPLRVITDFICSTTLNDLDLYSITPIADISSVDSINVIQMNCNWGNDVATTGLAVQLQLVTQGTVTSPSSYVLNSTGSSTNFINGSSFPIPRFTVYTDYNGNPITKSVLESAEFGVKMTSDTSANYIEIQAMWLTVEYVPTLTSFSLGSMMSYYPGF